MLREIRALAETVTAEDGSIAIQKEEWSSVHFHIVSQNNFPTAAGMASSAAGYSCLGKRFLRAIELPISGQ